MSLKISIIKAVAANNAPALSMLCFAASSTVIFTVSTVSGVCVKSISN